MNPGQLGGVKLPTTGRPYVKKADLRYDNGVKPQKWGKGGNNAYPRWVIEWAAVKETAD